MFLRTSSGMEGLLGLKQVWEIHDTGPFTPEIIWTIAIAILVYTVKRMWNGDRSVQSGEQYVVTKLLKRFKTFDRFVYS